MPGTNSSSTSVPFRRKLVEWSRQFALLARRPTQEAGDIGDILARIESYDHLTRKFVGRPLTDCSVLEIGFGARPTNLLTLVALGVDAIGVDLDHPVLGLRDIPRTLRSNGLERASKSLVRYLMFDVREDKAFIGAVSRVSGAEFEIPRDRLIVSDAADPGFWEANPGPYDLIISEDVFEHIPRQGLSVLVPLMSRHLSRRGIALIRPMVWTGIKGGHSVEYYGYIGGPAPSNVPPWDHLREARHPANTFLNQLTRREYVELFETCFEVIEDEPLMPWLGRELLTGEIRDQLAHYDDYELFSNKVSFVLRPDRMDHSSQEHG